MDNSFEGLIDFEKLINNTQYLDQAIDKIEKLELTGTEASEALINSFNNIKNSFTQVASAFKKAPTQDLGTQLSQLVISLNDLVRANDILIKKYVELGRTSEAAVKSQKEAFSQLPQHTKDLIRELDKAASSWYKLSDAQKADLAAAKQRLSVQNMSEEQLKQEYLAIEQMLTAYESLQFGVKATAAAQKELADGTAAFLKTQERANADADIAADSYYGLSKSLGEILEWYKKLSAEERKTINLAETADDYITKLREIEAVMNDALHPKSGVRKALVEELTNNIEALENYKAQIATITKEIASIENEYRADVSSLGNASEAFLAENKTPIISQYETFSVALEKAKVSQEEYKTSVEKMLEVDNLAEMSIKELENRVSGLRQAYTLLKGEGLNDFGEQILQASLQAGLALDDLKAKMNAILKPGPAEGSIEFFRQKISDLKKEISSMPKIDPVKVQELHEAEDALDNLTESLKRNREEITELEHMRRRLAKMQEHNRVLMTDEYKELQKNISLAKQEQHQKELNLKLDLAKVGSYEELKAQYNIYQNTIKNLSNTEQNRADILVEVYEKQGLVEMSTQELAEKTANLYQQMKTINESYGKHAMNVGNYARTFDGLTFSVVQVVRELPAAAINMNTFFLAISNNIPMVIDQIQIVKAQAAAAEKEVPSTFKIIGSAMKTWMFWLNVIIAVLGLALSKSDKVMAKIKEWAEAIKGLTDTEKALKAINEQFKAGGKEFGKAYTSFYMLREEYKNLKNEAEKQTWIKNHRNDFHQLGVSVTNLKDAEVLFVEKSDLFVQALMKQAMAAAALKAAQDKLEKGFEAFMEAELSQEKMKELLKNAGYSYEMGEEIADDMLRGYYDRAKSKIKIYEQNLVKDMAAADVESTIINRRRSAPKDVKNAYAIVNAYEKSEKSLKKVTETEGEVSNIMTAAAKYAEQYNIALETSGILAADLEKKTTKTKEHIKDIANYINNTHLKVLKLYNDIFEEGQEDEIQKRSDKALNQYKERVETFNNIWARNLEMLKSSTKALTTDQIDKLNDMNNMIDKAIIQLQKNYVRAVQLIELDRQIREKNREEKRASANLAIIRGDIETEYAYRRQLINIEMQKELLENAKLLEEEQIDESLIRSKYFLKQLDLQRKFNADILALRKQLNDAVLLNTNKYSKDAYKATLDNINIAFTNEVEDILTKAGINYAGIMSTYSEINAEQGTEAANAFLNNYIQALTNSDAQSALKLAMAKYQQEVNKAIEETQTSALDLQHQLELSKLNNGGGLQRDLLTTQHEIENLELRLKLAQANIIKLSDAEIQIILNNINKAKQNLIDLRIKAFSQHGILGGFLANVAPGFFGDEQLDALDAAKNYIKSALTDILETEIQIREKEKELAEARVDEAKSVYEKEIEARNNGYAHSVNTAKKELLLQQRTLAKKQAELEKANRAKLALDSIEQAASLTTATANIWAAFTKLGPYGIILAALATAGMFTAFVTSKAKASELTATYGEGGLEFLRGGSHASGNDIDLHMKNRNGYRMRAEGGEALAIINRRNAAKYRSILPGLIASLNTGTYMQEYSDSINAVQHFIQPGVNLNNIENSLGTLIKQGKKQIYELNGTTIIIDGNTRTTIKHLN